MVFCKGHKGKNGTSSRGRVSLRRRLTVTKGTSKSKKSRSGIPPNPPSPAITTTDTNATPNTFQNILGDPKRNLDATSDNIAIASGTTPAGCQQPTRTNEVRSVRSGVSYYVEEEDDDSDDEDYEEHRQTITEEIIRASILVQYIGILRSRDNEKCEDRCGGKGIISRIEDALRGNHSHLIRKHIRSTIQNIRECWVRGYDYCPYCNGKCFCKDKNAKLHIIVHILCFLSLMEASLAVFGRCN